MAEFLAELRKPLSPSLAFAFIQKTGYVAGEPVPKPWDWDCHAIELDRKTAEEVIGYLNGEYRLVKIRLKKPLVNES